MGSMKDAEKQKIIEFMNQKFAAESQGMQPAMMDPTIEQTQLMAAQGESPELPLAQDDEALLHQMQGAEIGIAMQEEALGRPIRSVASEKAKNSERDLKAAEKKKLKEMWKKIHKLQFSPEE